MRRNDSEARGAARERVTDVDIHVRKTTSTEGGVEVVKSSVAAGGRTYLLDGMPEEAEQAVLLALREIS